MEKNENADEFPEKNIKETSNSTTKCRKSSIKK
jgi:hypothetical protein